VLREGLAPVAIGLAIGIVGSLVAGRGVQTLLFEVKHDDPFTILAVCALLGIVAVVACAIPARRATSIGVASLLRSSE